MASIASERLREVLDFWLDTCMFYEQIAKLHDKASMRRNGIIVPPVIDNWRIYEEAVFDNSVPELDLQQWSVSTADRKWFPVLWELALFPFEFFAWSRKSRRSFVLPPGLQRLFASATYPSVKWEDVLLPFDSFIIVLNEPLRLEERDGIWSDYDAILVTRMPDGMITMRLMRPSHTTPEGGRFPKNVIRRGEIMRRRDPHAAKEYLMNQCQAWEERYKVSPAGRFWSLFIPAMMNGDNKVAIESADFALQYQHPLVGGAEEAAWRFDAISWAAKIVVGWCLYLQSMSSSNLSWAEHRERMQFRRGRRGLTGVITNVDHVCTILGNGTIDPATYGLSESEHREGSSFFVRPHWRRAHMRREPGTAPDAPKTVKVPPTLVRKDLLPLFGLVGGTNTRVLEEE